ncbi:MAG: helix-turn-helix domain-containing protein [Muribaculaceae bacterium]|nr:helix-turn-helix domain-containing protein [Muribaculaceae bacterium]
MIREERGLTQQEFAELVNMQPNSIGQIEIGNKGVSFNTLEIFSQKLNLEYYEFFNFSDYVEDKEVLSNSITKEIQKLDVDTQKFMLVVIRSLVKLLKIKNL